MERELKVLILSKTLDSARSRAVSLGYNPKEVIFACEGDRVCKIRGIRFDLVFIFKDFCQTRNAVEYFSCMEGFIHEKSFIYEINESSE